MRSGVLWVGAGGEVVRTHWYWELHGSDVGGVGSMGPIWGNSEGLEPRPGGVEYRGLSLCL